MSNQVISYADLSIINSALRSISSDMNGVHSELGTLNFKQGLLEGELLKLADFFADFVEADIKHKALQLAETRQGNLKQDLQIRFGYYAEVRRMATGILQGVDTGVVSDETLKFTTEEVMIKAPGYWLAPALVTLASWIRGDKKNYEKALNESLKRDDYRTTLFFMLVMRRLARNEASFRWLERYFMHQNPHDLDREFIIILEAVTTGIFPPAARNLMMTNVKGWLNQLTKGDNYLDEQKSQWLGFFEASVPLSNSNFQLLEKFASNWSNLDSSMNEARLHSILHSHFNKIISTSADLSKGIKVQLDEILSMLVTNFDDEELPLQEQVRFNQLIIELDGDKNAAQAKIDAEKHIFDEKIDFLQLLTNACFNPELSGATIVTQALAVSISQPWIVEAHDTFTAQCRNRIPQTIDLNIDGFKTSIKDGNEETKLLLDQEAFYQNELETELGNLAYPTGGVIVGSLISLLGVWALFQQMAIAGIVFLGIGAVLIWNKIKNYNQAKEMIRINIAEREAAAVEVLRGCIAETVDYRNVHSKEDSQAEVLRNLLNSILPEDFSSVSKDISRNIL